MSDADHCRHPTLYFASGGYYVICSSCRMSWIATSLEGAYNYQAGDHGLDGNDIRVEAEASKSASRTRTT